MIAFTAQYDSGEIQIDPNEIEDAGWYQAPDLPPLPGKISIAYRLIEDYINHQSI
jgi:NAD+ diphosphatase